jgi:hypothetical protein
MEHKMTTALSRREFASLLALGTAWPLASSFAAGPNASADTGPGNNAAQKNFRIRTITAGVHLSSAANLDPAKAAVAFLHQARSRFEAEGFEVQTLRLATQPLARYLPDWKSPTGLTAIKALDQFAVDSKVGCSIGPVITDDQYQPEFGAWAAELAQQTSVSFSCQVASAAGGVHSRALRSAAEAIHAISRATSGGEGNFGFAATAFIPSGTPFFPAGWFDQGMAFSIGLETPNLLTAAFEGRTDFTDAKQRLKASMESALGPVAALAYELAQGSGWNYLGMDTSPAPGLDASIGRAIETLTRVPFGNPSTLAACAAITDVLKGLSIKTCGYSGLMLPVLEDTVLAQRAAEGRFGVAELLLYSNVCGTGLDVVPLPGDASVEELSAVIADVAALASKYQKPLSARLFPAPGRKAGETVRFDNPHLTECVVMPLG